MSDLPKVQIEPCTAYDIYAEKNFIDKCNILMIKGKSKTHKIAMTK